MRIPDKVHINEVCPRDGWQKYKDVIPTHQKIDLIRAMIDYGAKSIEIGVFSQLSKLSRQYLDLDAVVREIAPYAKEKNVELTSLVNNYDDARRSMESGIHNVSCFVSVCDRFGREFGSTAEKSFAELEKI